MPVFENRTSIAFATSFFTAMRKLPPAVMRDVISFQERFTTDPTSNGLNYEKIQCRDGTLRSARINKGFRVIIKVPQESKPNVYTLLWVDSHDAAYEWAAKKHIGVNPTTNEIEIYDVIDKPQEEELFAVKNQNPKELFLGINDEDFSKIGIPDNLIFLIRKIEDASQLRNIEPFLPIRAFENLSFLAAGIPYDEVLELYLSSYASEISSGALSYEEAIISKRNADGFYVVEGTEEAKALLDIMKKGFEEWRVFLHPRQREIAERYYSGPAHITGGAGTGKTIVAMHRSRWLADHVCHNQNERILFTTFTKNLADDIRKNLKILCTPSQLVKIDISNLDKWISDHLSAAGIKSKLIFGDTVKNIWEAAMKNAEMTYHFPVNFLMEEYEKVILANDTANAEEYHKVKRIGRGIALNRSQKNEIWNVVESYKRLLDQQKVLDINTASTVLKDMLDKGEAAFNYRCIVVDEGQDFGDASYKLIRALAGPERDNDVFIVGDAYQRIYGKKVELRHCGINVEGRKGSLKINYRTTSEIQTFARRVLGNIEVDDMNGGIDEGKGHLSLTHGDEPNLVLSSSLEVEQNALLTVLNDWLSKGFEASQICIVARTAGNINRAKQYLAGKNIETYEIKNTNTEDDTRQGIRLATMHRVKGIEFECVAIIDVNEGQVPLESVLNSATDPIHRKELNYQERSLFYVAATRARKQLAVFTSSRPSSLLETILEGFKKDHSDEIGVFVYGTLMQGHGNHHLLNQHDHTMAPARLDDFGLYQVASFPGIVPEKFNAVRGEYYKVSKETLDTLDRLEGEGSLYLRKSVTVTLEVSGSNVKAYTYIWNNVIETKKRISYEEQPWMKAKIQQENAEATLQDKNSLIWYACYGANTNIDYLINRYISRCSDKTPPSRCESITIDHRLYFAKNSPSWDNQGVAFISTTKDESAGTLGAVYLITEEQFGEIRREEGLAWYDKILKLGVKEGIPIYTFTHSRSQESNPPCDRYKDTIITGLMRVWNLDREGAERYLDEHVG